MGATDQKAVDFISKLPNSEIKLSYNSRNERLHAKTYIFKRNTGFDTAYIGSSNISRSALTNGLEWNLKVTTKEISHIIDKFKSTFETYWASSDFEIYSHNEPRDQKKLRISLRIGKGFKENNTELFFDIKPHYYQKEILEKLTIERTIHNRTRNLVVAATGTGKTIISVFDFKSFLNNKPDAKLLFVAHREEILKQSRTQFRAILKDSNFGELWVGNSTPEYFNQLFISVTMLNTRIEEISKLSRDFYDFIVIDEVHHIAAKSYRTILNQFNPQILLGLTATPERHDGEDILKDFCGTIAAELRLPDAINQRYLCPFQYFGIDDTTDISNVKWINGRYAKNELTNIYTDDKYRVDHILRNMDDIIGNLQSIKALGYCVTKKHAQFMTTEFNNKGVKASVLTSDNRDERIKLRQKLMQGIINVLFVVDIFNEGVDIPEIDTLLFLRPTESLTIFLQQLGRGLRLSDNKDCLTVLDFVGNANANYDFNSKFRALIGKSHRSTIDELKDDFPHLPLGCSIVLQKQAKETIFNNIKNAIFNQNKLIKWIKSYFEHTHQKLTLKNFLNFNPSITIEDIYKYGWNELCKKADIKTASNNEELSNIIKRAISKRFITCKSRSYLKFVLNLIHENFEWNEQDEIENQCALMTYYDFWQKPNNDNRFSTLKESLKFLGTDKKLIYECEEALEILLDGLDITESIMDLDFPIALKLHGRYCRDQILSAFGEHSFIKKSNSREGVINIKEKNCELLFVTLNKLEKNYSPTTLYCFMQVGIPHYCNYFSPLPGGEF